MSTLSRPNPLRTVRGIITSVVIVFLFIAFHPRSSDAQFVPLPPPSPSTNTADRANPVPNDNKAPVIEILSTSLTAGKNVFKVRITDNSGVKLAEIKYVHEGKIKTVDFVKDINDNYKALIDIEPPSRVIVIDAEDQEGNVATEVREYNLTPHPNILQQIEDFFSGIFSKRP